MAGSYMLRTFFAVTLVLFWRQWEFVIRHHFRGMTESTKLAEMMDVPALAPIWNSLQQGECSCQSATRMIGDQKCCERYLVRFHKMGIVMSSTLLNDYKLPADPKEIKGDDYHLHVPKSDFRAVVITRNMINSIISGYLYHKSGKECHLDSVGRPWEPKWWAWRENKWNWDDHFTHPGTYPKRKGRSICKYLEEESEEDGMRVYMEFAMIQYYQQLFSVWERATKIKEDPYYGRVFFQCYEDYMGPDKELPEVQKTIDYLFPAGNSGIRLPRRAKERDASLHSTSKNPFLRSRLRKLIREYDANIFNNTLAKHQQALNCGSWYEEQEHITPETCNCLTASEKMRDKCCDRFLVRLHKMGFVLGEELVKDYNIPVAMKEIKGNDYQLRVGEVDFRAVVIIRNMVSSIISGYLYHKAGRECHLDSVGNPWTPTWWSWRENKWNWEDHFTYPGSYPARNNRSLCTYLEEESEEDGMRVYIEFAMIQYYQQLWSLWERATQKTDDPYYGKIFFRCYENFLEPTTELKEVKQTVDLLFPDGKSGVELPSQPKSRDASAHSTSRDPVLRARLSKLIHEYDANVFGNTLQKHQEVFNCGPSFSES